MAQRKARAKRTLQLNVNVSPDEREMLQSLADEQGVTASDVVRLLIRREAQKPMLQDLERKKK
jgi:uncharacterized protein (DUF1778 family)